MDDPRWQIDIIKSKIDRGEENPDEVHEIKMLYRKYFEEKNIQLESLKTLQDLYDTLTGKSDFSRVNVNVDMGNSALERQISICSSDRCSSAVADEVTATIDEQMRQYDTRQYLNEPYAIEDSNLPAEENYLPMINEEAELNRKKKRVYRFVAERAAHKFREIGANLGARECQMDDLETSYPADRSQMLYKLFECIEADELEGPKIFLKRICDSLRQEKLFALRDQVQKIITLG